MKHIDTKRREAIERLERPVDPLASTRRSRNNAVETNEEIRNRRMLEAARLRAKFGSLVK